MDSARKTRVRVAMWGKTEVSFLLIKVVSHPGHGESMRYVVGKWTYFSFLMLFLCSSKTLLQFCVVFLQYAACSDCVGGFVWV